MLLFLPRLTFLSTFWQILLEIVSSFVYGETSIMEYCLTLSTFHHIVFILQGLGQNVSYSMKSQVYPLCLVRTNLSIIFVCEALWTFFDYSAHQIIL